MVNFRWRTTARGRGKVYRRRTTVVCFKWRTLGKEIQWLASNGKRWWLSSVKDSGELQMENYSNWVQMITTVVGFKWRMMVAFYGERQ